MVVFGCVENVGILLEVGLWSRIILLYCGVCGGIVGGLLLWFCLGWGGVWGVSDDVVVV